MGSGLTRTERYSIELYLQSYATHKDFTIEDWLKARDMVKNSYKMQQYIKHITKH